MYTGTLIPVAIGFQYGRHAGILTERGKRWKRFSSRKDQHAAGATTANRWHGGYRRSVPRGNALLAEKCQPHSATATGQPEHSPGLTFSARLRSSFDSPLFASDDILKRVSSAVHGETPERAEKYAYLVAAHGPRAERVNSRETLAAFVADCASLGRLDGRETERGGRAKVVCARIRGQRCIHFDVEFSTFVIRGLWCLQHL